MELNFKERFANCYGSNVVSNFMKKNKNLNYRSSDELEKNKFFHLDCKFTRKKVCSCKLFMNSSNIDQNMSNFLLSLLNEEITIDLNSVDRKIEFVSNDNNSKYYEKRSQIVGERLKSIDYNQIKTFIKNNEELHLSVSDYKEIEKNINDDKKICENCKTNIYENNYHKGWKNEVGEYVLLCSLCSKKYFNGALEIKFDAYSRKEDNLSLSRPTNINNNFYQITKHDLPSAIQTSKINFQVTNSSRPVEDPILLGNKRMLDRDSYDLICSNKKCFKTGKRNDFVACSKCEKYYHPYCVEPNVVMKFVTRFKWNCPTCKLCQICSKNDEKMVLNKCSTCDRSFHQNCYNLIETPINRKLYCHDCIKCKNCNKTLPVLNTINQNDFLNIKGYRVCDECWKYYKNVNYI